MQVVRYGHVDCVCESMFTGSFDLVTGIIKYYMF